MAITEHICVRCGAVFKRKLHLERHKNRKIKCEYMRLDDDDKEPMAIAVSTDDLVLDDENLTFKPLPQFDFIKQIDPNDTFACVMCGIRRAGKTTLIRYLYPFLTHLYDAVFFISNSIHNPIYDFVTGPRFDDQHTAMFRDLLHFQKKSGNLLKLMVILDDCISTKKKDDDKLLQFFTRGRNSRIGTIISTQSLHLCNRNNRNNCDYVILGNCPNAEFRKDVIEAFLIGCSGLNIPKFIKTKHQKLEYLNKFFLHHTSDHQWLIIDNTKGKVYGFKVQMNELI